MEFGRTDIATLETTNLTLPPDAPQNASLLPGRPLATPKILLGCPTWGHKCWLDKLYPTNTKEQQFSNHYPQHFNSIEFNATHYKIYDAAFFNRLREKTAGYGDFVFCPKLYNGISHDGRLTDKLPLLHVFLDSIDFLHPQLGPVFIQLSDGFGPFRKEELYAFLKQLPRTHQFFLEVRHEGWFSNSSVNNELFGLLQQLNIGAVITDTPGRRDCAHMRLTVPKTFIRFVGNNLHPTDEQRVNDWAQRIAYWLQQGLEELYFFSHMPNEERCPELINMLAGLLNSACGLDLRRPQFREPSVRKMVQGSMFE